jgi:beta-catenin-like protein 1
MSRMRAFKVLDHALRGEKVNACTRFVTLGGLKSLFTAFLKKGSSKYKKAYPDFSQQEEDEHIVSILYSLFLNLQEQEHSINRIIFKFIEEDFEKLHRLLLLHVEYSHKMLLIKSDDYLDRIDGGLYTLQLLDCIILFLCKLNPDMAERIPLFLAELQEEMAPIKFCVQGNRIDSFSNGLIL